MKILSIGTGLICGALLCGQAAAGETDYAAGTQALPLQQAGGTARSMAMGSAVVAVSQGSASLLWNPAGLSRINCTEIGIHHNTGLGDTIQEIAVFGAPMGDVKKDCVKCNGGSMGGIAASIGYVSYGNFDSRNDTGLLIGQYHANDYSASIGWGKELFRNFAAGIALKGNHSHIDNTGYNAFASDIGILWKAVPSLDLGVTYSNIDLVNNIGKLVSGWRVGAGWTVDKHLLLAASGELQNSAMNRLQVGAEYLVGNTENIKNVVALRAGYQVNYPDPQLSGLTGLTLGLGYTLTRTMALDYAMVPTGNLGASHRLSLTFKFGCPKRKKAVVAVAFVAPPATLAAATPLMPAPEPVVLKWVILEDSHFDFDSSALRPEGMAALRENVQLLKDNPETHVQVAGYTSMSGTEEYNQLLSERRAAAVTDFLVKDGIDPSRITTVGYGKLRPAEYEADPKKLHTEAAKANKRVVFTVPPVAQ